MQVGIYVPMSEIFPDVQPVLPAFTSLLRKLSLTDVLFWCARLNHVVTSRSNLTHEQKQAFGLRQFFSSVEIERLDRFVRRSGARNGPSRSSSAASFSSLSAGRPCCATITRMTEPRSRTLKNAAFLRNCVLWPVMSGRNGHMATRFVSKAASTPRGSGR